MLSWHGSLRYDILYRSIVTDWYKQEFAFTNDTPYLALTGELWSVCSENFEKIGCVIMAVHCKWFVKWFAVEKLGSNPTQIKMPY